ncbi:MAG: ABC transporter permease [Bdellovibrionota bacterium]|nr:MAG: ABC transporter permease [Bdellovibrionota bacterium]
MVLTSFASSLIDYRHYLRQSVARDLKKRYKRSVLGYVWSMLYPLLMMAVLAVAFSKILGSTVPDYPVFLFVGMIPFQFFSTTINGCLGIIGANIKIIDQVPTPKYIFPASIAISNLINLLLSLVPLFLIMLAFGRPIPWTALLLPLVLLPLFMATMGLSLIFCVADVFFDDTRHLTGLLIQSLYFLSPVLYGPQHLPDWLIPWVQWNPMFFIIEMMRDLLFLGVLPAPGIYAFSFLLCLLYLLAGLLLFEKTQDKFMYFI